MRVLALLLTFTAVAAAEPIPGSTRVQLRAATGAARAEKRVKVQHWKNVRGALRQVVKDRDLRQALRATGNSIVLAQKTRAYGRRNGVDLGAYVTRLVLGPRGLVEE